MQIFTSPSRRERPVASADQLVNPPANWIDPRKPVVAAAVPVPLPALAAVPEPPVDLRQAQFELTEKLAAAAAADLLVEKAAERLIEAREQKAKVETLSEKAIRLIAERMKSRDDRSLATELEEADRAAFGVERAITSAERVLALLTDEARAARVEAEACQVRVAKAADALMQAHALKIVARMRESEAEAGRLRGLALAVVASRPVGAAPCDWSITSISYDYHSGAMLESAAPGWKDAGAVWVAYRNELLAGNADAAGPE